MTNERFTENSYEQALKERLLEYQYPPEAYEYLVNGKSAIEWIVECYCVSQDKKSLIKNDAND